MAHLTLVRNGDEPRRLTILSIFRLGREIVRINRSGNPLRACGQALQYMRSNRYEATTVEVYDDVTGKVYAVLRRSVTGNVSTVFEEEFDPERGV